jgi:hypothetical protein
MRATATELMAIPAIAPPLRLLEPVDLDATGGAEEDCAGEEVLDDEDVVVEEEEEGAEEDEGGADVDEADEDPLPDGPPGPKFTYAAQSGLGAASGQLGSWHRESNCGAPPVVDSMGGEHRTLYMLFRSVVMVSVSCSENPKCCVDCPI